MRNLLISTAEAELNGYASGILSEKRNRSFVKDRKQLTNVLETIQLANVGLPSGYQFGVAPAFNLNRPVFNRFFERMSRALMHEELNTGFVDCSAEWHPISDIDFRSAFLKRATILRKVSKEFAFAAHKAKQKDAWLWLMTFFGKDFLVRLSVNGGMGNRAEQ